ncbi:SprB repeat-containing protein, partial [Flavobacterium sp. GSA192]|uniref:SprB repeat-containing protein n=1 Tax=Flavobacterium sp. GSA192 TaxID=2576304 RepID=UPI0015E47E15
TITPAQTGLAAGLHTFTVTDAKGCTTTIDVTITEPTNALSASASNQVNVSCKGGNDGSVVITPAGGTAGYTITPAQTGLAAGLHTFTVTDAKGCTTSIDVTITEPTNALSASASNQVNVSCKGGNDGSVVITPAGGTAGYTITPAQTGLAAGLHTFTVTDAKGCTTTIDVTITEPTNALSATAGSQVNVSCKGGNDGSVVITPAGGTAGYTITPAQTGLAAGLHTFTVTDAKGCTTTIDVTILDGDGTPPVISQLPSETTINCPSKPEFAQATATDNVDTSVSLTFEDVTTPGQCAGSYSVTRTWTAIDDCGNTATKSQKINVQDITAPTFTVPADITVNAGANCVSNLDPTTTGAVTNISDACDQNPTVTYIDSNCFGNDAKTNINAGNGNYFYFNVNGFDNLTAKDIEKVALAFETNQGKGRAEFTLVAPSGQAVVLVGPYCTGGACEDANSNDQELYLPVFYPNSSGNPQWNNNDVISQDIPQNFTPNGALSSPNVITGVTSYVSSFENLTGSMNGTWFIYSKKQASVNGSIQFNSICLTPATACTSNKVITRTWTVTDQCGNAASATQTIKIQDVTAPVLSEAPADITVECSAVPTAATLTATDNCDVNPVVTYNEVKSNISETCASNYTLTRTWTAKDACGNESSKSQIITVEDKTKPVFVEALPANVTVECSEIPQAVTLTATDN